MALCTALLIFLSAAESGKVWAREPGGVEYALAWTAEDSSNPQKIQMHPKSPLESVQARTARDTNGRGLTFNSLPNMTRTVVDSQKHYTWQTYGPADKRTEELWVDLAAVDQSQVRMHGILSNARRQAVHVALSFDFPFYGHKVRQITIATGGFIFMGEVTHRMLTATQYIAPLMASFDPSFSKNSTVWYWNNEEMFVVQWDKVRLQDQESLGYFTFQAALHRSGTIVFNYRDIPLAVGEINTDAHPVKVGLSDAFISRSTASSSDGADTQKHTIYEYHRVEVNTSKITNHSAVELTPLPTCLQQETCTQCLFSNLTSDCGWCNVLQRCSDGMDRHRQEWLDYGCTEQAKGANCADYTTDPHGYTESFNTVSPELTSSVEVLPVSAVNDDLETSPPTGKGAPEHTGIIAGVVTAVILLVILIVLALYYINTHPTIAPPFYLMQQRANNYWPSMKFRNQGQQSSYADGEVGGQEKEGIIESEQC